MTAREKAVFLDNEMHRAIARYLEGSETTDGDIDCLQQLWDDDEPDRTGD